MIIDFILNGEDVSTQAEPMERLSDLLREKFQLSSLMSDCLEGRCGKCLVFLGGHLVNSCLVPAFRVRGTEIITYEGFKSTDTHDLVHTSFDQEGIELCGFCDAAVYMAAGSLLDAAVQPSEDRIMETISSVYCRCATPTATMQAIHAAVDLKFGGKYGRAR